MRKSRHSAGNEQGMTNRLSKKCSRLVTVTRWVLCGCLWVSALAWAQPRPASPDDCDDNFAECKEDCTITYGGNTSDKARAKVGKCLGKCNTVELECRERFYETKRNNLDEGALKDSPGSGRVDEDGLPTTRAPSKKKDREEGRTKVSESPAPEPKPEPKREEELRDDPPARAEKKKEPPPPAELKPEETPKSNRTQLTKVDPKPEPKRAPERQDPAPARAEPPKKTSTLDRDVREEDSAPTKREEPKREEPKKKKSLDEWDPDS